MRGLAFLPGQGNRLRAPLGSASVRPRPAPVAAELFSGARFASDVGARRP